MFPQKNNLSLSVEVTTIPELLTNLYEFQKEN